MICSRLQRAEIQELEDLITEPLHNKGHLYGASLTTLFWHSGIMVTYMFIWQHMVISSGFTILALRS
jgi:hypothetical protein